MFGKGESKKEFSSVDERKSEENGEWVNERTKVNYK